MANTSLQSISGLCGIVLGTGLIHAQDNAPPASTDDVSTAAIISGRETVSTIEDGTVAEALERRPDLSFANITLDGEESGVSLSDLDAEAVSSVEVLRAVTPEMDADARGGSLSLRSKPAFALEAPRTAFAWEFNRHRPSGRIWNELIFNHARAVGDLGLRLNAGWEFGEWASPRYFADWQRDTETSPPRLSRVRLSNRLTDGEERTLGAALDYRVSERFHLYLRGEYEDAEESFYQANLVLRWDETDEQPEPGAQFGRVDRDTVGYDATGHNGTLTLGGYYEGPEWDADFRFLYNDRSYLEPNFFVVEFSRENSDLAHTLDPDGHVVPLFPESIDDPTEFRFEAYNELFSERWETGTEESIGALNLSRRVSLWKGDASIRTGVKWRQRDARQIAETNVFTDFDGDFLLRDVLGSYRSDPIIGGRYEHGVFPSIEAARTFFSDHRERFFFNEARTIEESAPTTWTVTETIPAFYGMIDWERGRWRILTGVREEETRLDYRANEVVFQPSETGETEVVTRPLQAETSYRNWFPGVHLRYFLGERTTLITSWTRTIKRGNYSHIVPYRRVDYQDQTIEEGNPALRPTLYSNFDAAVDFKLSDGTLLALDLSYIKATDEVFDEEVLITEGLFEGFRRERKNNGPSADIYSAKFTWQQELAQWWDGLAGLSWNLSARWQESATELPQRPGETLEVVERPPLQLQSVLNYAVGPHFFQLLYEYTDRSREQVSDIAWRDRFEDVQHDLTFSFSWAFNDRWRLLGEVENLLDQSRFDYLGERSRLVQHRRGDRSLELTLRWDH